MLRNLGIAAMLGSALVMPVHEATAQDALAILGGGAGANVRTGRGFWCTRAIATKQAFAA